MQLAASHKSFIAVQNANSSRDIAAKMREDPLLAIKQQEQSAYQALLSNPLRLAKMQKDLGVKPAKDKKDRKREKEERKRLKRERKHRRETEPRSRSPSVMRDRSPLPDRHRHSSRPRSLRYYSSSSSRSPSPVVPRRYDDDNSRRSRRYSPDPYRGRNRSRSPLRSKLDSEEPYRRPRPRSSDGRRDEQPYRQRTPDYGKRSRSPNSRPRSPARKRVRADHSPPRPQSSTITDAEARNARLAAMASNATVMSADRQQRLAALLEKEKAELEADEQARAKSKGMSGFLSQEQKRVFGGAGGLEDRIRRGRGGMIVDAD